MAKKKTQIELMSKYFPATDPANDLVCGVRDRNHYGLRCAGD